MITDIREQIRWLREGVAGGHAITIADTMEKLLAVLDAAQVPRHDYCGTDDWFIELDKAVYLATADFGERYRDKYADSGNATRKHNET